MDFLSSLQLLIFNFSDFLLYETKIKEKREQIIKSEEFF